MVTLENIYLQVGLQSGHVAFIYLGICASTSMYVTTINKDMNLKEQQGGTYEKVWREKVESE